MLLYLGLENLLPHLCRNTRRRGRKVP